MSFKLFGLTVRLYGVIIAFGVLAAFLLMCRRERRLGLPKDLSMDLLLAILPAGLAGARLYYVLFSWREYAADPIRALFVWEGGLAIYGGLIFGALAVILFARRRRIPLALLADLCAPSAALGQAIGRWGNFVNEEAYGIVSPIRAFPFSVFIRADGQWHYACFFYESLWCLCVALALLCLERRRRFRRTGDMALLYGALYAFERFWVEALRTDSLMLGPLRVSRLLSFALCLSCTAALLRKRKEHPCASPRK